MKHSEKYPNLFDFFATYYPEMWHNLYEHDDSDKRVTYPEVAILFTTENPRETVLNVIEELKQLLSENLPEEKLRPVLAFDLGLYLGPTRMTYKELLQHFLEILLTTIEDTNQLDL